MSADRWIALAGVVIAALALWLPLWLSMRRDRTERARQAVTDATGPLIAERDYLRQRVDQLEDQLRAVYRGE